MRIRYILHTVEQCNGGAVVTRGRHLQFIIITQSSSIEISMQTDKIVKQSFN